MSFQIKGRYVEILLQLQKIPGVNKFLLFLIWWDRHQFRFFIFMFRTIGISNDIALINNFHG